MKLVQLKQLFAMPLQSAISAQQSAIQETLAFIDRFGLEAGTAKTLRFKAERIVEERVVTKSGAETQFKSEPFELSIPLLALVPPPNMSLQEMNVEFGVEVVEPVSETSKTNDTTSLSSSLSRLTSLGQSTPVMMKVNMKIVSQVPEGMARLGDILTDLINGKAAPERIKVDKDNIVKPK